MRRTIRRLPGVLFALSLAVLAGGLAEAQDDPLEALYPLPVDSGRIDDKAGLSLFAVRDRDSETAGPRWQELKGCTAHLIRIRSRDRGPHAVGAEESFPCRTWNLLPQGLYLAWIEGDWKMSPSFRRIPYSHREMEGNGRQEPMPVAPAGKVTLPFTQDIESSFRLRLFAAEDRGGWDGLSREDSVPDAVEGVLMPEGRVIAGLWDDERERYTRLSRPFDVKPYEVVEAPLRSPGSGTDVFVRLRRADFAYREESAYRVNLALVHGDRSIAPDLVSPTDYSLYAVWYGVGAGPPGRMELRAGSRMEGLVAREIDLPPGRVVSVEDGLHPLPELGLRLEVPPQLDDERGEVLAVEIVRLPNGDVHDRHVFRPGGRVHRFTQMPLTEYRVILETAVASYEFDVDLRAGEDETLVLEPPIVALTGTVRDDAGEGQAATLRFALEDETVLAVATDETGLYEVVLPIPAVSVEIEPKGRADLLWREDFKRPIDRSGPLDLQPP